MVFAVLCDCTQSSFQHYTLHGFCCTLWLYTVKFSALYTAWFLLYSVTVHSQVFSIIHCMVFAVLCDCTQSSFQHYTLHGFYCTLWLYTVKFSALYTAWFLLYSVTVHSPVFSIIHCMVFAVLCDCTQSSFQHYTLHVFCCTLWLYTVKFSALYTAWFLLLKAAQF